MTKLSSSIKRRNAVKAQKSEPNYEGVIPSTVVTINQLLDEEVHLSMLLIRPDYKGEALTYQYTPKRLNL